MAHLIRKTLLRLPNEEIERHTTWLEIFFDLIFAVIIIQLSERLIHHLTLTGILQCIALFFPVMWTWASYTVFSARFDNEDAVHWLMTFIIMFAGIVMAIQIPVALEKGATGFSIGFLIGQVGVLLLYARTIYDNLTPKDITKLYMVGFGLGLLCWLISLFFDGPTKFIFWSLGMGIYMLTPWIGKKRILSQAPLDIVYIPERFGAFTIIILGQIIASVVFGLAPTNWEPFSLLTSVMAFTLAVLIWTQYYRFTLVADYKGTLGSGQPYIYTHIPLIISLILIGACTEDFIKNSNLIQTNINIIFCCSVILYLTSFYLLQYISMHHFKIRGFSYVVGVIAILFVFSVFSLPPLLAISTVVFIFIILFSIQYWLDV